MYFSRISFKLALIMGFALIALAVMAPIALLTLRSQMMADRGAKTQQMIDVGYGILANYHRLETTGQLTQAQAQAGAIAEIKSLRYDKAEYFWINDMTPRMVVNPVKPELDGQDLSAMQDPAGNRLFMGFVDVVKKQGAGFYSYLWPKPGFDQPVPKISYVKGFEPWGWIIGTGIYLDDVAAVFNRTAMTFALVCAAVFAAALISVVFIGRSITRPLTSITGLTERLASGDSNFEVPYTERKDEVGALAKALHVFKENLIRARELAAHEAEAIQLQLARATRVNELAESFDHDVSSVLKSVASASTELQTTASQMSATAEETSTQATAVAAATEQATTNVEIVATASEELASSENEINRQVAQSATIAHKAVAEADRTNATVQGLYNDAASISDVVKLITEIADQTNLLALNATIEAARAGDAGRGFAVVAAEVKSLASQTAKATEQIGMRVSSIQTSSSEAVSAIKGIGATIHEMNQIASAIASAVEEQQAATQEIARNVQQAALGTNEISSNVSGVRQAAGDTGAAAQQVLSASNELSRQAEMMRTRVETFLSNIKAA